KKSYYSWKDSKHKDVPCVQCHYPPERLYIKIPEHRRIPADEETAFKRRELEFMRVELEVFSRLVTVLNMEDSMVLRKPKIDDRNCTASKCHPTTGRGKEGEYWTKKITFTELVREDKSKRVIPFIHNTHFDKEKLIEGQEMHCGTCHRHETEKKHLEVSKESCYLCHFKNIALNEKRSKCSLCHEIPTKPFREGEPEPGKILITHQVLEERKVSCADCHLHIVKGKGEIKPEKCLDCHENEKVIMKEMENKKLMHNEHVAKQTASCFNCHEPIQHKYLKEFTYADAGVNVCVACHSEPHIQQKLLIAGEGGKGIDKPFPIKHHDMRTNCLACHTQEVADIKGRKVKRGEVKTCVLCHTEDEGKLAENWKADVADEIQSAREIEKNAVEAVEKAKGKVPEETLQKAMALLKDGQENLRLVDIGGGVHNKKYAMLVIETAVERFEELMEELKSNPR
ncbi:MAG: cytochrome c3 family protein, partial [Candidatus Roizmanbacteria bacterium]|nr:cytochrome c3 family protein [Candidatus Roizmanbacteria bacterium]